MKRLSCLFALLLLTLPTIGTASERLHVLLFEHDPWLMVMGSDSPVFASYGSGLTIFRTSKKSQPETYSSVMLDEQEKNSLIAAMSKLAPLKKQYTLSQHSDQTSIELHFFDKVVTAKTGSLTRRAAYGTLRKGSSTRTKAPAELVAAYDLLTNFSHKDAAPWTPEYLEIMVWPYEYAPDKSIIWPRDWPDTKSASTQKRGGSFSIFLPYDKKQQFDKFIKTLTQKAAVVINGKKLALSVRIPFPHELAQNKALAKPQP